MGDRSDTRPLPTQDDATQRKADTYPCPERGSNIESKFLSGQRQYVPYTTRPLGPAISI
jgi:hypothetical protein